ncbi:hypothetical protein HAP99_11740 [Acidithiobacillus caldus]|uniref:hypothetical protein n=1 Tax=Acidithiobacillus caldus TaxID=33059 RepID=UPI001C07058B|nr:hypothetical protein [Acidithiobacillus caldus]MBU2783834.1 hypothetical protein [Acidithiobacillus caldus]
MAVSTVKAKSFPKVREARIHWYRESLEKMSFWKFTFWFVSERIKDVFRVAFDVLGVLTLGVIVPAIFAVFVFPGGVFLMIVRS